VSFAVAIGAGVAPAARAEFGPIQLISKSTKEQADEAVAPAISADGRYVAFAGKLGGRYGVFRKDLQTGAVLLVVELSNAEAMREARPSISADGRFVAFTTTAQLDPEDDTVAGTSDVYVADAGVSPPTYELASAIDGCDPATSAASCGLTYAEGIGSVAAGRVALSEDGRRVAFLVRGESDLAGPGTPPGEVAVRDLDSDQTYLMTVREGTAEPMPGGGATPASEGAAISGDGSTVAWVGRHLPGQVPMLPDEEATVVAFEGEDPPTVGSEYHEPLWRRVPTPLEPDPPTRRVVGGGDPLAPGCPAGGTLAVPDCQGPFPDSANGLADGALEEQSGRGWGLGVPRLSRDGVTVALVGSPEEGTDLFVVDMAPGLSRRQAVRRLTRWVNPVPGAPNTELPFKEEFWASSGPILDCAISPSGNRIAFTTVRRLFPLAPPTLVSPQLSGAATTAELYQIDLGAQTIERVTPGGTAGSSAGDSSAPSYDADGTLLTFSSTASNLVTGDTNEAGDVFLVESPLPSPVEESTISRRPPALVIQPLWRMTVAAASLPNGRVRVTVGVPGAGSVGAKAAARPGKKLKLRRVAAAHRNAPGAGVQRLELRLPPKLRGLAHKKGGLNAQLDINFTGPGGKPLHAALDVRFLVHHRKTKKAKR
jgi:hypothetical protein